MCVHASSVTETEIIRQAALGHLQPASSLTLGRLLSNAYQPLVQFGCE